jgi:transcription elongation factor Elf1
MSQLQFETWSKAQKSGWNGTKSTLKASLYCIPQGVFPLLFTADELDDRFLLASSIECVQNDSNSARGLTCITCGLKFLSHSEQQTHFKSDLHLVNLKRKLAGKAIKAQAQELDTEVAVDASSIDAIALQQQESESSEESEGSDQEKDVKEEVEEDSLRPAEVRTSEGVLKRECSAHRGPAFHVQDASIPGWEAVLSAALFPAGSVFSGRDWVSLGESDRKGAADAKKQCESPLWSTLGAHLRAVQANSISAVFLLRSGRFAGAVFSGSNLLIHKV